MDLNLKGKYALVTGGSHGIGRAIALELANEKCNVAICARNEDRLERVVEEIKNKGVEGIGIVADVTYKLDIEKIINKIIDSWKTLDILVNNIGGGGSWGTETYEEFDEWETVYEKNAGASRKFTMSFLPYMKKQNWGRVITIASIYGKEAGGRPWFNMANAAEISLMKNLAGKYEGITFNTICPGHIDVGKPIPDNPTIVGKPEDVSGIVAFLCSNKAKHINGACITVDGGESKSF